MWILKELKFSGRCTYRIVFVNQSALAIHRLLPDAGQPRDGVDAGYPLPSASFSGLVDGDIRKHLSRIPRTSMETSLPPRPGLAASSVGGVAIAIATDLAGSSATQHNRPIQAPLSSNSGCSSRAEPHLLPILILSLSWRVAEDDVWRSL